jgi:hypothetical protein
MLERGKTINRKLIFRLSVMGPAVSAAVAIVAALSEQKNVMDLAVNRATLASGRFSTMIAEQLDAPARKSLKRGNTGRSASGRESGSKRSVKA